MSDLDDLCGKRPDRIVGGKAFYDGYGTQALADAAAAKKESTQVHWPEEHQSEERLVADIHRKLLNQMQSRWLVKKELTIADLLNGRYDCGLAEEVEFWFFADWNSKIGRPCFGHELFESLRKEAGRG